jgi:1-acyl-sn-glycerol-3-phosphate acyltransferase
VLVLRSVAFNVLFYSNLVLHMILALPTFALPRGAFMALARSWGRTSNLLLRVVAGIAVEYRGLEKIPPGALLVASKHQSVWETFTLVTLFDDPAYVYKRSFSGFRCSVGISGSPAWCRSIAMRAAARWRV